MPIGWQGIIFDWIIGVQWRLGFLCERMECQKPCKRHSFQFVIGLKQLSTARKNRNHLKGLMQITYPLDKNSSNRLENAAQVWFPTVDKWVGRLGFEFFYLRWKKEFSRMDTKEKIESTKLCFWLRTMKAASTQNMSKYEFKTPGRRAIAQR